MIDTRIDTTNTYIKVKNKHINYRIKLIIVFVTLSSHDDKSHRPKQNPPPPLQITWKCTIQRPSTWKPKKHCTNKRSTKAPRQFELSVIQRSRPSPRSVFSAATWLSSFAPSRPRGRPRLPGRSAFCSSCSAVPRCASGVRSHRTWESSSVPGRNPCDRPPWIPRPCPPPSETLCDSGTASSLRKFNYLCNLRGRVCAKGFQSACFVVINTSRAVITTRHCLTSWRIFQGKSIDYDVQLVPGYYLKL